MSDMKFTPGPWIDVLAFGSVVKKEGTYPLPVDDDRHDGESWLEMRWRTQSARDAREAEAAANKQVQIAAPDMYEALSLAVEKLKEYAEADEEANGYGDGCFQRPDEFIEATVAKCSAALAKARGES